MRRVIPIALMFSMAVWGFTGFMSNMVDFSHGWGQVEFVVTMAGEGAKEAPGWGWRHISSPLLIYTLASIGFAFIYMSKLLTGVFCLYACVRMFKSRHADVETFDAAKQWGIFGCGISVIMLFLGFISITGQYFAYWRVPYLGSVALEYAFYYLLSLMSFIIYLQIPERQLR